jgi:hypothetical protein
MPTKLDDRQVVNRAALPMVGGAANDTLDTIFPKIDTELSKLFEDRNFILAGGGTIAVNGTGTSVTFSAALKLHVNSLVSGATPSIIDLAATTRAFTSDGNMLYAVINRTAATAVVTADSATLPAVTSSNQEVVLIAKRIGTTIFFRNGTCFPINTSSSFDGGINGSVGATDNQLVRTDGTGTHNIQGSGITIDDSNNMTGIASQTVATNIITGTERENISTDSSTTGSNATLATPTTPIVRLTNASLVSIDMLAAGASGQQQTIVNATGAAYTLNNLTGATTGNQFLTGTNANLSIANNASIIVKYDDTSSKWRVIGGSGSGSGTGGINYILTPDAEAGTVGWSAYSDTQTFTVTIASPAVFTVGSTTGYYAGQSHVFTTTGALPTGLTAGTTYYISTVINSTTFRVSATLGGADVNTSGTQSGTHTDRPLSPIDATGGSPTTTWTTSTSSPLRGLSSFLLTKTAADLAGEGVSYAFTIDTADKGKVLQGYVDYAVASGTYVDNDVTFWIYDVTNAVMIQPAPYLLKNHTLASDRMPFEFQTSSSSTSYRLVMHLSSNSASAYTLKFDNFNVGPQAKLYGSANLDWIAYTPTGTWVTNTSYVGRWRKVGDTMEIQAKITTSGAPSGTFTLNLPSGFTIDTTKLLATSGTESVPNAVATINDSGTNLYDATVQYNTSTSVILRVKGVVTYVVYQGNTVTSTLPVSFGSGDFITMSFAVPIQGWSSSQVMSSDADTRVVSASASGNVGSITANNPIKFPTVGFDTHGAYSAVTGQYIAPISGYYQANLYVGLTTLASVQFNVYVNGVIDNLIGSTTASNGTGGGSVIVFAKGGQTIDIRGGNTVNYSSSQFTIQRISGPAQIAASETVAASYWLSANFAASTTIPINFDSKEFDSHNAVTTSATAWKFTAPMSGTYNIESFTSVSGAGTTAIIYKNGSSYKYSATVPTGGGANFTTPIKLLAGEFIDVRPASAQTINGGALNALNSHISIIRVGNY